MKHLLVVFVVFANELCAADPQIQEILTIARSQVDANPYRVAFTSGKLYQLLAVRRASAFNPDKSEVNILKKEEADELSKLIGSRTDVQTGATPSNSGTSSLAMKGAVPKIIGFAAENGAIESSVKGTVITFRATPWGVFKALQGSGYFEILDSLQSSPEAGFLKRISLAASFDTSKGVESPALLANRQQLQSWSVRGELYNNRDAGLLLYHNYWGELASQAALGLALKKGIISGSLTLRTQFSDWPELTSWYEASQKRVENEIEAKKISGTAAETVFLKITEEQLAKFDKLEPPHSIVAAIRAYVFELKSVLLSRNAIVNYAQRGSLATLDFTVKRDAALPDLSIVTGIWETHIGARLEKNADAIKLENLDDRRNHDLTINGALSFFNSPAKVSAGKEYRMRDFKLTTQYDIPLGKIERIGNFIWTNAFRYQRLFEDAPISLLSTLNPNLANSSTTSIGASTVAIAKRGNFAVYQTKLTIPAGSGIRIPLSFSIANRSELLSEKKDINANIGITFDLDAIFAKASK